ncbi:hypothetical protein ACFQ03_14030 [Paenibacillus residui]|uniref:Uncharacterized protein n=2 Tax=Paenibacillaceae TaxID=186822 RepID=A0ABW3DCL5_9BACL
MNSLTNIEAAEKIIYLDALEYNERWGHRVIRGFGDPLVKQRLQDLFEERYPDDGPEVE